MIKFTSMTCSGCPGKKFCFTNLADDTHLISTTQSLKKIRVALIGNPNTGKSCIFNELTHGKQYIGNWPGVTVEKKEGKLRYNSYEIVITDLPGTYNLGAISIDEKISRDYIIEEKPDVVVQVVDSTKLERNLYLTIELLESGANVVLALNMFDQLEAWGIKIDVEKLKQILGLEAVPTVAIRGEGLEELVKKIVQKGLNPASNPIPITYNRDIEKAISQLIQEIKKIGIKANPRWVAIKLLEEDQDIIEKVKFYGGNEIIKISKELITEIWDKNGVHPSFLISQTRYNFIKEIISKTVSRKVETTLTLTDLIDHVVTHKVWSLPIFFIVIWSMFKFTFDVAAPFVDAIDITFSLLAEWVKNAVTIDWLGSLLADGVIGGVGFVLVFFPNIFMLFLYMSIMEDIGYMSRAAYNLDSLLRRIGLSGKSIIPMLLGMGCNVPAIMSARTIDSHEDRLVTILVTPLIPCSARLPVFIMIASIFFAKMASLAVLSMYFLGFTLAILIALLLRKIIFKGRILPFIMELPNYKTPTMSLTFSQTWNRAKHFLKKVGGVILILSIVMWFLLNMPYGAPIEDSYGALLGKTIEPILRPLGFTWEIALALIFGFIAKEVVISALGVIFSGAAETALVSILSPASAFALMAFVLIYTPCIPTLVTIKNETNSWKWLVVTLFYELTLAYFIALGIVLIGNLLF